VYQHLIECRGDGSDIAWGEVFQARLLEAGLHLDDYNRRNPFNASALHCACLTSDKAACRYLINQGVDVNRGVDKIRCPIISCQHSRSGADGWDIRQLPRERDVDSAIPMTILTASTSLRCCSM
jgi:ankyrin repeat protein